MLERAERARLLELARRSVEAGAGRGGADPVPEEDWSSALLTPRATFVTLTVREALRGCRGTIEPERPLYADVWHNAWASAYTDPRFWPLDERELPSLSIAISVLTALEPLAAQSEAQLLDALEPGRDGLVLRWGGAAATFLPAVWETLPEPRAFLAQLKAKAGWPPSFWPPDMVALRYGTETFRSADASARNARNTSSAASG
jgi:AmmeMemoRadiSam system protein A